MAVRVIRALCLVTILSLVILSTSIAAAGQAGGAVDVTGKWTFQVQTSAGGGTPAVTLKQDGEKLTGHYSSQQLGEADLTGTVKGRDIAFAFTASAQGVSLNVTYTGVIDGKDAMKGKVSLGEFGDGTFTAKRD